MKIFIALATFNRRFITEKCIKNLVAFKKNHFLYITDDFSYEYILPDINNWANDNNTKATIVNYKIGIHEIRYIQLQEFLKTDNDLIYFTDNDTIHDVNFIDRLLYLYDYKKTVISLYNTKHHAHSTVVSNNNITIRKTVPGISQLYNREMATEILKKPVSNTVSWDYDFVIRLYKAKLIDNVITSTTSYVDHIGAFGIHNEKFDLQRDRAFNPTNFLKIERENVITEYVEHLNKQDSRYITF